MVASDLQLFLCSFTTESLLYISSGFILNLEQSFMIDNNPIYQEETLNLLFAYKVAWPYA
jgi:hypothetical protein